MSYRVEGVVTCTWLQSMKNSGVLLYLFISVSLVWPQMGPKALFTISSLSIHISVLCCPLLFTLVVLDWGVGSGVFSVVIRGRLGSGKAGVGPLFTPGVSGPRPDHFFCIPNRAGCSLCWLGVQWTFLGSIMITERDCIIFYTYTIFGTA